MSGERAIVVRQTALQVNDAEASRRAQSLIRHAQDGGGLFESSMTQAQAVQIARLSLAYGLDPFAREITLYQGQPYVTYKGRLRVAVEHPMYDGMEEPEWADEATRKAFRVEQDEMFCIVRVWRKDRRLPFVGYGRAGGRRDEKQPVAKARPDDMAIERARRRALTEAFALPIPDLPEGARVNAQRATAAEGYVSPHMAEQPTGVIEGEAREITEGVGPEPPATDTDDGSGEPSLCTEGQRKAIKAGAKALGWDDNHYRARLFEMFSKASLKELTENEAAALIDAIKAEGENGAPSTPEQHMRIRGFAKDPVVGLTLGQIEGLCEHEYRCGIDALNRDQADALIAMIVPSEAERLRSGTLPMPGSVA